MERQLRDYQYELAVPGLSGLNYIICAPTGSGKTVVAAYIIAEHLQLPTRKTVLFIVDKVHLATQQKTVLEKYISGAKVMEVTGHGSTTSKMSVALVPPTADFTDVMVCEGLRDGSMDILVTTAGYIDFVMKGDVKITDFSLLILDECHHTDKQHPYARIMMGYLKEKEKGNMNVPQVIGLTASPGAGGASSVMNICENLINLCAYMDAYGGIHTVTKNKDDLDRFRNIPAHEIIVCEGRSEGDECIAKLTMVMQGIEQEFLYHEHRPKFPKTSQMYPQKLKEFQQSEQMKDDEMNAIEVLLLLAKGLNIYMDLEKGDMEVYLEECKVFLPKAESISSAQRKLRTKYNDIVSELQSIKDVTNPLLLKLESLILNEMPQGSESKAIVFVETQRQAKSICKWVKQRERLKCRVIPYAVVGQRREDGMTKAEQVSNIESMRDGDTNLLVATSILEEGVDIPKCDLVIRYQRVSNDIATVQVEGRARAKDSKVFTIVSSQKKKNQEYMNRERAKLVEDAIAVVPSGEFLKRQLMSKQKDILCKETMQQEVTQIRKKQSSAFDVQIKCKKCPQILCHGSDLRTYFEHRLVIDPTFHSKVTAREKEKPKYDKQFIRTHDILCNRCGNDVGVKGIPLKRNTDEYFALTRKQIQVIVGGTIRAIKTWKDLDFEIENLTL